jgi:hypothetical protein
MAPLRIGHNKATCLMDESPLGDGGRWKSSACKRGKDNRYAMVCWRYCLAAAGGSGLVMCLSLLMKSISLVPPVFCRVKERLFFQPPNVPQAGFPSQV